MPAKKSFRYALVQFRPNPARAEGAVSLGVVVEFVRSNAWVVGLAMRAELPSDLLAKMDPLSRELADCRIDLVRQEVEKARHTAKAPGDVLRILSESNPWSLFVTAPREQQPDASKNLDALSLERLAEEFVFEVHHRELSEPTAPDLAAFVENVPSYAVVGHAPVMQSSPEVFAPASLGSEVPPAWMLPPRVWINPWSGSGR